MSTAGTGTARADVVIVGARCAGSPLATLLAQAGLSVIVLEQARFPRPVLSSHLMEADALSFLTRLGVRSEIEATGVRFLRNADIRLNELSFAQPFPLHFDDAGGAAFLRRHLLDDILARRAGAVGVDMRMNSKVVDLLWQDQRVCGVRVRQDGAEYDIEADLVVGADGRFSSVAYLAGSRKYNVIPSERSYYFTFFEGADPEFEDLFVFHRWGDRMVWGGAADSGLFLIGVSPEEHEREYFKSNTEAGLLAHMRACPVTNKALRHARIATKIAGISSFDGYFRQATGPGWVLAGDAGHFKDPALGRGIGDAFRQAETLFEAIMEGRRGDVDDALQRWWTRRDEFFEGHYWLAANLGRAGALPVTVEQAVRTRQERNDLAPFFDLFSHRSKYDEVFPLTELATATATATLSSSRPNKILRQATTLLAREPVRRLRRRASRLGSPDLTTAMPRLSDPGRDELTESSEPQHAHAEAR